MNEKVSKLMQTRDQRYKILKIHRDTDFDPVNLEIMDLLFDWANRMGLEGKRVSALEVTNEQFPDPVRVMKEVSCCVWEPIDKIIEDQKGVPTCRHEK